MKTIATITDTILNVDYVLNSTNSKELSETLKKTLISKNIDYNLFNKDYDEKNILELPKDIYEYQNFFLLERENEYVLLDGFRRLLWSETHNQDILVRVYKEKDISEHTILKLLISLNHTKFFGNIGNFYDRGFALAMYSVFNIDITKIYDSFNGYLTLNNHKYIYYNSYLTREKAHISTLEKISNPAFLADMRFLQMLKEFDIIEQDEVFGSFIQSIRQTNPDIIFDAIDFISKVKENKVLMKQIETFKKSKDSRRFDIGNKMFEMFQNILLNKTDEKSFAERNSEIKDIVASMKKEKEWFNYTTNKKYFFSMISNLRDKDDKLYQTKGVENAIKSYFEKNGCYPKVKVVVYPSEKPLLKEGVYDDFEIVGFETTKHLMSSWNIIQVKRQDIVIKKSWNKDNRYDLSRIEKSDMNNKLYNDVVLYIKDLDFEL